MSCLNNSVNIFYFYFVQMIYMILKKCLVIQLDILLKIKYILLKMIMARIIIFVCMYPNIKVKMTVHR